MGQRSHPQRELTVEYILDVLLSQGLIDEIQRLEIENREEEVRKILFRKWKGQDLSQRKGEPLITPLEIIASMKIPLSKDKEKVLSEEVIMTALAKHLGLPYEKIDPLKLDPVLITQTFSLPFARRNSVLLLEIKDNLAKVAVADPFSEELFSTIKKIIGLKLKVVLSTKSDIQKTITEIYGFRSSVSAAASEISRGIDLGNLEQYVKLKRVDEIEATDKHIINAVEYLFHYAFDQRASDIHIEPKRTKSVVRFRIDGVLHKVHEIPISVHPAIVARTKMLARLDIAERRKPQDGRIKTERDGREIEIRVSTVPVGFGEKVVLRIFDPEVLIQDLGELGFSDHELKIYESFISRSWGMILVTGPTGSGKTTTLYSTLKVLSSPGVNITTIEDPIEMIMEHLNQIAVQPKIDLTFAVALRHILRQDPDIIMVGEIRDFETAQYAVQAALTGHLVFSTLHTNDSASTITRLIDLGLDPFLISSTLIGVLAQRLLRKICKKCRTQVILTPDQLNLLGVQLSPEKRQRLKVWKGKGCIDCRGTGFHGRTGIFEILKVTQEIRRLINQRRDSKEIMQTARRQGMKTLKESGIIKLFKGITSFEEVVRVTSSGLEE